MDRPGSGSGRVGYWTGADGTDCFELDFTMAHAWNDVKARMHANRLHDIDDNAEPIYNAALIDFASRWI